MKIKLEIDLKWLVVFFIGIFLGIGITNAYPTIGDTSYFNFIRGDCSNCSNLPAAQIKGNFTQRVNFSSTIYVTGLTATTPSGSAICKDLGTGEMTVNTGIVDCSSSTITVKENVQTLPETAIAPEKFNALRPIKFNYKGESKERIGLVAEEVEKIYPQVVGKDENGTIRGINYGQLVPLLIEKIQQQDTIIQAQSNAINNLQLEIKNLGSNVTFTPIPTYTASEKEWWEFWK